MQPTPASFAKTSRPNLPNIAARPRLFTLLDAGREASLLWITGPPGSGKTTLVADYLDTFADDYLWYQVDPSDSDVATFFYYMSEAVSSNIGGDGQSLPAFTPEYLADLRVFARRYFRELFSRLGKPFAIVFDNYQDLPEDSRLHEVLKDGLEEIPAEGCILFISRQDPPASMARLRANSRLRLIDWEALRLTREECEEIARLRGQELAANVIEQIFEKTQGWAAGLVLMLEQLRSTGMVAELPETVTPKVIFDYLAGELLADYSEEDKRFLLRTAMPSRVSADIANALTGRKDAGELLAQYAASNFMISASTDHRQEIYQYHPLLREFLVETAEQELGSKEFLRLRAQAARLLEDSGETEEAIHLAIESSDWEHLAGLIKRQAPGMLEQGRGETLAQWLRALPDEQRNSDPWLLYWLAAAQFTASPRQSREIYRQSFELFEAAGKVDLEGLFYACAGVMDACLHDLDDLTYLDPWLDKVEELLGLYPGQFETEAGMRLTCNMYMSLVFRQPFHPDIESWGERTYALIPRTRDSELRLQAALRLVSGIVWTGRFTTALQIIESIRTVADSPDVSPFMLITLHNIESMYFMLAGDHESCIRAVEKGVELSESVGIHIWRNSLLINGVGSALCWGDLDLAAELLEKLDQSALQTRRYDLCLHHYYTSWLHVLRGELDEAHGHLRSAVRLAVDMGLPFFEVIGKLCLAQVLFERDEDQEGARYLKEVRAKARTINNHILEFLCFLVFADIAFANQRASTARKALEYAMSLGRQHGYTNMVWWQPRMMARLAVNALRLGIEEGYVRNLVIRRALVPETPPLHLDNWPWPFRVRTLGNFAVEARGKQDAFRGKERSRPFQLLKTAIALGGQRVSAERLTGALWPRIDADYAHRSFNTNLHRLRKMLGEEGAVVLEGGKLSLDPAYFWLDIWALEQALDEQRRLLRADHAGIDAAAVAAGADRILSLYLGPFMPDDEDAWIIARRDKLKSRVGRWMLDYTRFLLAGNQAEAAIAVLERGLEADEAAEGLYRQLMLCYEQLDRKAEAIEVFNRCRTALADRLDVEPSPETTAIYQKLTLST